MKCRVHCVGIEAQKEALRFTGCGTGSDGGPVSPASQAPSLRLPDHLIGQNDFKADRDWKIEKSLI